jgi:hypothetical protein
MADIFAYKKSNLANGNKKDMYRKVSGKDKKSHGWVKLTGAKKMWEKNNGEHADYVYDPATRLVGTVDAISTSLKRGDDPSIPSDTNSIYTRSFKFSDLGGSSFTREVERMKASKSTETYLVNFDTMLNYKWSNRGTGTAKPKKAPKSPGSPRAAKGLSVMEKLAKTRADWKKLAADGKRSDPKTKFPFINLNEFDGRPASAKVRNGPNPDNNSGRGTLFYSKNENYPISIASENALQRLELFQRVLADNGDNGFASVIDDFRRVNQGVVSPNLGRAASPRAMTPPAAQPNIELMPSVAQLPTTTGRPPLTRMPLVGGQGSARPSTLAFGGAGRSPGRT